MSASETKTIGIASWPQYERPRERLLSKGAQALTDAELVAILLRVGFKGTNAVELAPAVVEAVRLASGDGGSSGHRVVGDQGTEGREGGAVDCGDGNSAARFDACDTWADGNKEHGDGGSVFAGAAARSSRGAVPSALSKPAQRPVGRRAHRPGFGGRCQAIAAEYCGNDVLLAFLPVINQFILALLRREKDAFLFKRTPTTLIYSLSLLDALLAYVDQAARGDVY